MSNFKIGSLYKFSKKTRATYDGRHADMLVYRPGLDPFIYPGVFTIDADTASFLCVKHYTDAYKNLRCVLLVRSITNETCEVSVDDKVGFKTYVEIL